MISELVDTILSDSLEVVHFNGGCFLRLLAVLFGEGFSSFSYFLYFRLIFDFKKIEGLDVIEKMLHIGGIGVYLLLFW